MSPGQDTSGLANLADKVFTVSHTLECTSNQPSTAVPAQINSSSRGRTPTADAEISSVQADSSIQNELMTNTANGTTVYMCLCVCFLPIHSGHQVRWTYQPGSHRRKVTQDF